MIAILIVALFALLCLLFVVHKQDIMYPSVILCIVYLICIAFAMYNYDVWDMQSYSGEAVALTLIAVGCFAFVGVIVEKALFSNRRYVSGISQESWNRIDEIQIPIWVIVADILYCMITMVWYFSEVRRIAGPASNWTMLMNAYRTRAVAMLDAEERMPYLLVQMTRLVTVQGYFFGYVLVNNLIARRFKARDVCLIPAVVAIGLYTIINANRFELLKVAAFFLIASYILWHRKYGWNRNLSMKYARIGVVSLMALLIGFYSLKDAVGRISTADPMYYISNYVGSGIRSFDLYLQSPPSSSTIWGKETFYAINQTLSRFGMDELLYTKHLEFRNINGLSVGNVYSALRRYHHDFGTMGIIVLPSIFSFFIHYAYCKIKYSTSRKADFRSLIYCLIFFVVPMFPIDDHFFSTVLSSLYIVNIFLLYVFYLALIRKRVRFRFRR